MKMIFWISKDILKDNLPWKNEPQSFNGSWNMPASVFLDFEWSKIDLGDNLEFGVPDRPDIAYYA